MFVTAGAARRTRCLRKTNQSCVRLHRKGWEVRRCQRTDDSLLCSARPGASRVEDTMIQSKEDNSPRQALTLAPLAWLRSTRSTIAESQNDVLWFCTGAFRGSFQRCWTLGAKSTARVVVCSSLLKKEAMVFQLTVENSPIAHANSTTSVQNSTVQ